MSCKHCTCVTTAVIVMLVLYTCGCASREDAVALELAKKHGLVSKESQNVVNVHITNKQGANELIPYLHRLRDLVSVSVSIQISDVNLETLGQLQQLKELSLMHCELKDDELVYLSGLTQLRVLNLAYNPLEGEGLKHLAQMQHLETLNLMRTNVESSGIGHLSNLRKLRILDLTHTKIDDLALRELKGVDSLTQLKLPGTNVSLDGVMQLAGLHRLEVLDVDDNLFGNPKEIAASRERKVAFMRRFQEAYRESKRRALASGEIVPSESKGPFSSVEPRQ